MAKLKTKKSKVATRSRESKYIDSLDFRTMWESFQYDIAKGGQRKYKTVWQFVCVQTKVGWQRDLLYWVLGPPVKTRDAASPYSKFEQYDFEAKREKGCWYASANVEQLGKQLNGIQGAMNKIAELGSVNVDFIGRLRAIMITIDQEFGGRLFIPELSAKRNRERVDMFMQLNRQVLEMITQAQLMYGKMQGVDLQQLTQFIQMMMLKAPGQSGFNQMLGIQSGEEVQEKHHGTFSKILDMVVQKAETYEMDLPDKKMEEIIVESRKPQLVAK